MKIGNKLKNALLIITTIAVCLCILLCFVSFTIKQNQKKYDEAVENPPTTFYVEEDAEKYLISTSLYVYDMEQEDEYCIYYIKDVVTLKKYKVAYELKVKSGKFGAVFYWEFVSFVEM